MASKLLAVLAALTLLSGCARDMSSSTYTTSKAAGKAVKGTVISMRTVTIKEHDKLSENTTGAFAGGAGGALAGAQVGNGNGSAAAALGGAVIGAVAGALVQDALSTSEGMEYLVEVDSKHARQKNSKTRKIVRESIKSDANDEIKSSIDTDMESNIVTVVQKADPAISEGSRVYIVYSDDRPRLVPAKAKAK